MTATGTTLTTEIRNLRQHADELADIASNDVFFGEITDAEYYAEMAWVEQLQGAAEILEDYKNGKPTFVFLSPLPEWAEVRGEEWQLRQQELEAEVSGINVQLAVANLRNAVIAKAHVLDVCPDCFGELKQEEALIACATRMEPADYATRVICIGTKTETGCGYAEED